MIYIVHGEGVATSRTNILNLQKKVNAAAKLEINLTDITPDQLVDQLSAFDMFGNAPFVVVDISSAHFSKFESFVKVLNKISAQANLVIFSSKELSKTNAFIKAAPTIKAVIMYSEPEISANVFKFVDTIFNLDKDTAYKELNNLLMAGEDPFYIFSMILYGFRNVASAGLNSPSFAKVAPFLKGKAMAQAKNFSEAELVAIYNDLYKLDKDVKTGNISPDLLIPVTIEKINKTRNT